MPTSNLKDALAGIVQCFLPWLKGNGIKIYSLSREGEKKDRRTADETGRYCMGRKEITGRDIKSKT